MIPQTYRRAKLKYVCVVRKKRRAVAQKGKKYQKFEKTSEAHHTKYIFISFYFPAAENIPEDEVDVDDDDDDDVEDDDMEDDEEVPDVDDVDDDEPVQSEEVVLLSSEDEEDEEEETYADEHFPPMEEPLEQEQESPSQIEESGGAIVPQMGEPMLMVSQPHHVIADSTEPLEEESSNVPSDEQVAAVPSSQQV